MLNLQINAVDYTFTFNFGRELKKLSEESLTRQPEEVFDILCKLGEGSYGSVFKALHKESRQILAIKQVINYTTKQTRPDKKYSLLKNRMTLGIKICYSSMPYNL